MQNPVERASGGGGGVTWLHLRRPAGLAQCQNRAGQQVRQAEQDLRRCCWAHRAAPGCCAVALGEVGCHSPAVVSSSAILGRREAGRPTEPREKLLRPVTVARLCVLKSFKDLLC